MPTGVRTRACRLTVAPAVAWKVKVKPSALFICPPLTKLQKIMAKLLLRGSLIDRCAELFSRVALITLVMAKHHSTMKGGDGEKKNANSTRKIE